MRPRGRTLTRQHPRDAVEISYTQACSLNYPTAYDCVLRTRFREAHNCTEAGTSSVRAWGLGTGQGSPYAWIGGDSLVSANKNSRTPAIPARSVSAPKYMENAKIHSCYIGILPVLQRMLVFQLSTESVNLTRSQERHKVHAVILASGVPGGVGASKVAARTSVQPEHEGCVIVRNWLRKLQSFYQKEKVVCGLIGEVGNRLAYAFEKISNTIPAERLNS